MRFASIAVTAVFLASLGITANAQDRQVLDNIRSEQALSPALRERLEERRGQSGSSAVVGHFSPASLNNLSSGNVLSLPLSTQLVSNITAISIETNGNGRQVVFGETQSVPGLPPGMATLIIDGATIAGSVQAPDGRMYRVYPMGEGETAIIELDYASLPPDHAAGDPFEDGARSEGFQQRQSRPAQARPLDREALPHRREDADDEPLLQAVPPSLLNRASPEMRTQLVQPLSPRLIERHRNWADIASEVQMHRIDIMVAFTGDARRAAEASFGDIDVLIDLAIAETNASFRNSNIWAD